MNKQNVIQERPVMCWSQVKEASRLLYFLKTRKVQRLIKFLTEHYQTVTDLYVAARLEQSEVSQFLRGMRYFDLVISKREGKYIFYKLNVHEMKRVKAVIKKIAVLGDTQVDDLEEEVYDNLVPSIPLNPVFPLQAVSNEI